MGATRWSMSSALAPQEAATLAHIPWTKARTCSLDRVCVTLAPSLKLTTRYEY
jgi:hypothetical protein